MKVTVHLHTILQRLSPEGRLDQVKVVLPSGSTLGELLENMEITLSSEDLLLVVNGRMAQPDQVLEDGDQVNLIPAISGG